MPRRHLVALASATLVALMALSPSQAAAAGAFSNFGGTWSGSGHIRLEGGRTEQLRCRASYAERGGGNAVGISLRCASASSRIELRAHLKASGNRVTGDWEEREFNASGSASGTASGNHISLSIDGGINGSMSVTTNGSRQTVSISTQNVALKGINIALARD